ncbi:MAG: hypothetical protein BM563_02595 [Bacteroidetes bacterium MedPE-SWsnd-G1]|mgnify:CR=1 FL=1|nr:MAG: hypothetical protein BM563_02595 [Bacteroidetes bacterium MedPE-SWsnd-G1]
MFKLKSKNRFFRNVLIISSVLFVLYLLFYFSLTKLQRSTLKTKVIHFLGLTDNSWEVKVSNSQINLTSPTLVIDGIYKSMEGPHATTIFSINDSLIKLVWINSFNVTALNTSESEILSNDFICHTNIDFYDGSYYGKWNLHHRIGSHYPRLTTMSNGIESYKFPKGFGFPIFTNEKLFTQTQVLNHNLKNKIFSVKHKIEIGFSPNYDKMKPLRSKPIYIMLPYDSNNPYKGSTTEFPNSCIPVTTKNHSYTDTEGQSYSGHWVIFKGKQTFKYDVSNQLELKDSTSLHHIATHLHPFAEKLSFFDATTNTIVYSSISMNYKDKVGLKNVSYFSDSIGVMLYPNHKYELILETNNTSNKNQDMMASMALFLYDKELDEKIKAYISNE